MSSASAPSSTHKLTVALALLSFSTMSDVEIIFEVREDDGSEGGEEGGTLVDRAVVDGFPDLLEVSSGVTRFVVSVPFGRSARESRRDRGSCSLL